MRKSTFPIALLLLILLFAVFPVLAQEGVESGLAVTLTADGFTIPETVESGITTISFANETEAPLTPIFARLNAEVAIEDFMTALQEGEEAAIALVTLLGSTMTMPMSTSEITYALEPGTHLLLNFGDGPPQIGQFAVTGSADVETELPEADMTVSLVDFAFAIPLTVPAGEQTWLVRNIGEQWHEVAIMEVDPDMSIAEIQQGILAEAQGPPAEATAEAAEPASEATAEATEAAMAEEGGPPAFLWLPMSPGQEALVPVNIPPGTYAVVCFLPDFASGHSHVELGMFQVITVS